MKKKILALTLAFALVFSTLPVFAGESYKVDNNSVGSELNPLKVSGEDGGINYLSLGDSIAFGYGIDEEKTSRWTKENPCLEDSYPDLISDYLIGSNTGNGVYEYGKSSFFQGAVCGEKVIDICKMLSPENYPNDKGLQSFINSYLSKKTSDTERDYDDYGAYLIGLREAVNKADFITITAGGNDTMSLLTTLLSASSSVTTEDLNKLFGKSTVAAYTAMKTVLLNQAKLIDSVSDKDGATEKSLTAIFGMLEPILYSMGGFVIGQNDVLDIIHEMNPDAVIAVTGMPALFDDVVFQLGSGDDAVVVDMDKIFAPMTKVLNSVIKNNAEERSSYVRYVDIYNVKTLMDLDKTKTAAKAYEGTKNEFTYEYSWDETTGKFIFSDTPDALQTGNIVMFLYDQFLKDTHPSKEGHEYIANQIMKNFKFDKTSDSKVNTIKNFISNLWTVVMSKSGLRKFVNLMSAVVTVDFAGLIKNFSSLFTLIKAFSSTAS